MTRDDLQKRIADAVKRSGYPLEQRVGHMLESKGWHAYHSVNYRDPMTNGERELDVLAYKIIQERRIELRIACKRSVAKPWILFTEDAERYYKHGNILKVTPVISDIERYRKLVAVLADLPLFSHPRRAINYTVFSGKDLDNEARSLMKDGLYSTLTSVYHRLFPGSLLLDERGTVYLFITVFDGLLFESYYDANQDCDEIREIQYGQWDKRFPLKTDVHEIRDASGRKVPLSSVLYYFSDWFRVEIMTWQHLPEYLVAIEPVFGGLSKAQLALVGLPWRDENFPRAVGPMPTF